MRLRIRILLDSVAAGTAVRKCRKCGLEKSLTNFKRKYGQTRRHTCNTCRHINPARAWVRTYLDSHPCVDCGEVDPDVLDFDHRDPKQKKGEVPKIAKSSLRRAEEEAAKCDVRCANCHRRRHARERRQGL